MIDNILLKFGSAPGGPPLTVDTTPLTIFVGPNNAGKSKILAELQGWCGSIAGNVNDALIAAVRFSPYAQAAIEAEITAITLPAEPHENVSAREAIIGGINPQSGSPFRIRVDKPSLFAEAQNPQGNMPHFGGFLLANTLRLDGTNRLNLLAHQQAGDLQRNPANILSKLFLDNELRGQLRDVVFDGIGRYLVIDPTNIGQLRVRLSKVAPRTEREEKGWEDESVMFHREALEIAKSSDGIRAFVGVLAVMQAGQPKIAMIDEPEAFLHPALAQKLGSALARTLRRSRKRLFVATHSANFLMGCIQANVPLNIVRLTYTEGAPTARLLQRDKIARLMRHPLLRSTGVLSGLFYEAVVVTEADSDRAFYQEVNERLLAAGDPRGIANCLFLNAQNKQTVWDIVKPLREMGIPSAGIVDIDVLVDGGQVWAKPLEGALLPALLHDALHRERVAVHDALRATGRRFKTEGGLDVLAPDAREAADMLFRRFAEYGAFIVPCGEVESWLPDLGAPGHGSAWLVAIFELMGDDPEAANYCRPTAGDVWDFVGAVKSWISNAERRGIPT